MDETSGTTFDPNEQDVRWVKPNLAPPFFGTMIIISPLLVSARLYQTILVTCTRTTTKTAPAASNTADFAMWHLTGTLRADSEKFKKVFHWICTIGLMPATMLPNKLS